MRPNENRPLTGGVMPVTTVVLPSGSEPAETLQKIQELRALMIDVACEFLVIRSADYPGDLAATMQSSGLQYWSNPSGASFTAACNDAVKIARGAFLLLMGEVGFETCEGLRLALDLLARRPECGAVCGAQVRGDGRLLQAGCVMASDGSIRFVGHGESTGAPPYRYERAVDCGAGPLVVRSREFQQAGGFDTRYAGLNHALADLSFRLRDVGLETWYCPELRAVVSDATVSQPAAGEPASRKDDVSTFRKTWRPVLERQYYQPGACAFRARDHAKHRHIVLVMDHTLPQPDRDAGSKALLHTMRELSRMGLLVKFWPDDQRYEQRLAIPLEREGIEVVIEPGAPGAFETFVSRHDVTIDFALLCRPNFAAPYVSILRRFSDARILFFGHDLHAQRMLAQSLVTGRAEDAAEAWKMFECERALWRAADAVIYPSDEEAEIAGMHAGRKKVHVVPLYVLDGDGAPPRRGPIDDNKLVFVACFGHPPNEDAAEWLVESVWPLVKARLPTMQLYLVGSMPTRRVQALASSNVHVTGAVTAEELDRHYQEAAVAITPMRFGGGVKLKVVEAMSRGVPLVTTPIGAQGLSSLEGRVMVTEDADAMADAVVALATDHTLASAMAASARSYVLGAYSGARMQRALWRALAASQALT